MQGAMPPTYRYQPATFNYTGPTGLTGLLADWELVNNQWLDSLGNYNLTASGSPTITSGFGNFSAVTAFSSGSSFLETAGGIDLPPTGSFTIVGWVNANYSTTVEPIHSQNESGNGSGFVLLTLTSEFIFSIFPSNNLDEGGEVSAAAPTNNTWAMVGCYYNAATNDIGISVNGGAYVITPGSENPSGYLASGLAVTLAGGGPHASSLAGWRVYDRVLSPVAIANQYNSGNGVTFAQLGGLAG